MAVFAESDKAASLPETHRNQIRAELLKYFGTPAMPRFRLPLIPAESAAEGGSAGQEAAQEPALTEVVSTDRLKQGAAVYAQQCAACHGLDGNGQGASAAYLNPKPRDYRRGIFKFTSTPYGYKPRKLDLIRTVRHGAKGTSMPAFPLLANDDVDVVVDYVMMLSYRGELETFVATEAEDYDADEPLESAMFAEYAQQVHDSWQTAATEPPVMPVTRRPTFDDESIKLGRYAFLTRGCAKCHGEDGRGYTQDNVGQDAWGNTVKAADLTAGMLHGGRRPIDVYRRIFSGINGTPMPAFKSTLAEGPEADPDALWHLVHYVLSIVDGRQVDFADVDARIQTEAAAKPAEPAAANESESPSPL